MSLLLNLFYGLLILVASPWLLWNAVRKGKYREGFAEKFLGRVPIRVSNSPCIWLHAVSVGEVNLLGTLIDELRRRRPDLEFVISTTTMTGHAVAKSRYASHTFFYCPLDFSWAVSAAMRRVRPDLLVLAELELWPNLIAAAKRRGAKVAVANGRMSEHSFRGYRKARPIIRRLLKKLDCIAVQTKTDGERFQQLGSPPQATVVTGSMKFDGAESNRQNGETMRLKKLAGIEDNDIVFLAGSTQSPEEQYALDTYRRLSASHPQLKLILVPRHPERFESVAELLNESGLPWQRRSQLETQNHHSKILLVDKIGELRAWWGLATIAFVGGSFGVREGQNMIEPAAYGAAVSFGPRTRNFRDVTALLLTSKAAVVVHSAEELTAFVERAINSPAYATQLGENARRVVAKQAGATRRTVDLLEPLLPPAHSIPGRHAA